MMLDKSLPEGRRWKQAGWANKLAVLLILSALTLTGTPAYAESGHDDGESLLDILHAKGTLTDEEYEQLQTKSNIINNVNHSESNNDTICPTISSHLTSVEDEDEEMPCKDNTFTIIINLYSFLVQFIA